MLIKKNNLSEKIRTDNALASKLTLDDVQNALVELASLISDQDDALVELACILADNQEEES